MGNSLGYYVSAYFFHLSWHALLEALYHASGHGECI